MLEPPDCTRSGTPAGQRIEERVLLVGGRQRVRRLGRRGPQLAGWEHLPLVGYVDRSGRNRQLVVHAKSAPVPTLGNLDCLPELVDRTRATDVVIALGGSSANKARGKLRQISAAGRTVRVHWVEGDDFVVPSLPDAATSVSYVPWTLLWQRAAKRTLDILAAGLGLLIISPLLLAIALAILCTTGRPIFYTQERVGQRGKRFRMWKFRSMRVDAEAATGPIWAEDHDRRCTRIGDWLRHSNLDELPQLWNVVKGDMSLVGPRPERPCFVEQFTAEHADYDLRHAAPVGLTGWAQVHGWRGKTSLRKRIQYDLDYIDRWSIWLDVRTLLMTVEHVLFGRTSWSARKSQK